MESPKKISYTGQKRQANQSISGGRALKSLNKSIFWTKHCLQEALQIRGCCAFNPERVLGSPRSQGALASIAFLSQCTGAVSSPNKLIFQGKESHEMTGLAAVSLVLPEPSPWAALANSPLRLEMKERAINFHMESKPLEGVDVFAWFTHPFIFPSSLSVPLEENGNRKGEKHTGKLFRTSLNSHR